MSLLSDVSAVRTAVTANSGGSGNYLNPSSINEGDTTRITLLGDKSLAGYEVWGTNSEGKRVSMKFRTQPAREDLQERASELNVTLKGDEKAKGFYAFFVYSYDAEKVQVFQFSQASLIDPIIASLSDEEIGAEPWSYDFKISATGTGMDKRYSAMCVPGKRRQAPVEKKINAAWEEVQEAGADLSNLLVGADVFKSVIP
jgi:hypothetical protein